VNGDFFAIDAGHRRLYGAGQRIVDLDTKAVVGTVADSLAYGAWAIAPELNRGFARDGAVFSLASGRVETKTVVHGDASVYDSSTGRAFLMGESVFVVDLKSGKVIGKLLVPGAGESAVADGMGRIYLNLIKQDSIAVLDARSLRRLGGFSVAPCKGPMGLAMDRVHRRLFAACSGAVAVVDADKGTVAAMIATPGHADQNAFDPETGLLFEPGASDGGGALSIIHEDAPNKYSIVQRLDHPAFANGKVVVDETTHRAYLPRLDADENFWYVVVAPVK
jgi:hypothetical protein